MSTTSKNNTLEKRTLKESIANYFKASLWYFQFCCFKRSFRLPFVYSFYLFISDNGNCNMCLVKVLLSVIHFTLLVCFGMGFSDNTHNSLWVMRGEFFEQCSSLMSSPSLFESIWLTGNFKTYKYSIALHKYQNIYI